MHGRQIIAALAAAALTAGWCAGLAAQEAETGELATAAQNPVADLISLPLQNNTLFGVGTSADISANLQALILYDAWESVSFAAGYRALWVDYDNGKQGTSDYFAYDTVTHGPQIGVIFRF